MSNVMMEQVILNLLFAWFLIFGFMGLLWLIHFPIKNAALVDVGWGLSLFLLAIFYVFYNSETIPNHRSTLLLIMLGLWSFRLSGYLFFTRIWKSEEEGRYVTLREKWKPNTGLKFFVFYQAQGLLNVFLSLPFLFVALNQETSLVGFEIFFISLFFIAWIGETVSDFQLYFFKKAPSNKGKVCDKGLWYYSRHPNYFFESIVWIAFSGLAIFSPFGYIGLLAPILIITSIFKVTGIPATEEQNRKTKGKEWEEYEKSTSIFVPWFKRVNKS